LLHDEPSRDHRYACRAVSRADGCPFRVFAATGGLMSYGMSKIGSDRDAGSYVDRVLRGEKPGDLPVQAPTTFELIVNLKTTRALGFEIWPRCSPTPVRCNIGGAAVCKASIAAVVLAVGIVSLVQEGTNAMVALAAGLRPALTMPAVETVALRKSVTVTRHIAVRHRGVIVRTRHVAVRHRGVTRTR